MIVPYPAGGSTDVLFRILADKLKERFGQSFIVENRPGAGGNVGIEVVAKSPPDGYTIGCATVGHFAINQFLYARMPYDAERDLVSPALTYEQPNVAVIAAQHVPAKTLAEFIAWGKARPNGITIGSPGPGTTPHLSGVLFAERAGVNAVQVPFRGAAQTIPAMLAGDVNFAKARCPAGTKVTGGGLRTIGGDHSVEVSSSVPADGRDSDHKPNDAWFGVATNGTGATNVKGPYGLRLAGAAGSERLYVADAGNNRILVLSTAGAAIGAFGTAGSGNGQLSQPHGVAISAATGDVAVADFANNRLSIWH